MRKLLSKPVCFPGQKEKGWSVEAIQQAAKELQLSPAAAGIFTRPQAELVEVNIGG